MTTKNPYQLSINLGQLFDMVCDQMMVDRLKALENKWARAIDFQFAWVKEGYIIEFVVDYMKFHSMRLI